MVYVSWLAKRERGDQRPGGVHLAVSPSNHGVRTVDTLDHQCILPPSSTVHQGPIPESSTGLLLGGELFCESVFIAVTLRKG